MECAYSVRFILILDRSLSMGSNVERIMRDIMPRVCERLRVPRHAKVCVVAFDSSVEIQRLTVDEIRTCGLKAEGLTRMAKAVELAFAEILKDVTGTVPKISTMLNIKRGLNI